MQRQSRHVPSKSVIEFPSSESPAVVPHGAFVGLGIETESASPGLVVKAGLNKDGPFPVTITMVGGQGFLHPDVAGMNSLYNCSHIELTWTTGTIRVFQKS